MNFVLHILICHVFSHRGIVNHVRIRTRNEGGGTKFFLVDPMGFDSLYDLIDYYQHSPLKAAEFEQILTDPVPQVIHHFYDRP